MSKRAVHLLVFDGFADWEPSFALAELRRSGGYAVVTVGFHPGSVRSMGGLVVQPDITLEDVDATAVRLLVLPGGDMWEDPTAYPAEKLTALLCRIEGEGTPIAAVCGATLAAARAGLLEDRRHTSNGSAYLREHVAGYLPRGRYQEELAVRDRGLITASGLGSIEFAREIFAELDVFSDGDRALWYRAFRHGEMPASTG